MQLSKSLVKVVIPQHFQPFIRQEMADINKIVFLTIRIFYKIIVRPIIILFFKNNRNMNVLLFTDESYG